MKSDGPALLTLVALQAGSTAGFLRNHRSGKFFQAVHINRIQQLSGLT